MDTALEIVNKIKSGKVTATQVVNESLAKIKDLDGKYGAFLEVFQKSAVKLAENVDRKKSEGKPLGKLAGVPVAIKDNILYKDHTMTCGSKILKGYVAPYNSTVVERLLKEDAIIIGRTNMDEFAMGSSCENSAYQKTFNPHNVECVPGGSSGGSAVAVATDMVSLSFGSDTGGSVRQPASFCGVVGLKPTYGLVSRYGLVAFSSSLDQIGPFAKNVDDAALALSVIGGHDLSDSTSAEVESQDYLSSNSEKKRFTIGVPKECFSSDVESETAAAFKNCIEKLKSAGAKIVDITLPNTKYAVAAYYIIAPCEASSNLARFDGIRYGFRAEDKDDKFSLNDVYEQSREQGFGPEVKRRIMIGTYALSAGYYDAYYAKAQKVRTLIRQDFDKAFKEVDCILTPTSPFPPFKIGEKINDPVKMYLSDVFTIPANLCGIPGISVPFGKTKNGLPLGVHLMGKPFFEKTLFNVAKILEQK
jgi:aspartyl-tRNA(Asn)/glutamyl-tRNA(Gln) amidotransferase subunit A